MNIPLQTHGNRLKEAEKISPNTLILPLQFKSLGQLSIFGFDPCNWKPNPGRCLAYFPKYYFDQAEGRCKQFIWGGCGGVVPFHTLEECERGCGCRLKY